MHTIASHTFSGIRTFFDMDGERGGTLILKNRASEGLKVPDYVPGMISLSSKVEMEKSERYEQQIALVNLKQQLSYELGDQPSLKSDSPDIGLKITETKMALSDITEKKRNLIQKIADKIFIKAEEKGGILLDESKKSQFKLGLQAAMDVEGIPESQRYAIIGQYAQGFLSAKQSHSSENIVISNNPQEGEIKDELLPNEIASAITPVVLDNPETLGRELLSSDPQVVGNVGSTDGEISLGEAAKEIQIYNTQATEYRNDLDSYSAASAMVIESEQLAYHPLLRYDILPEDYDSTIASAHLGNAEFISNIPEGKTLRVNWADENGATQVQCTHLSDGDFVLSFPDGETIIIDSNGDSEKAAKEIGLIQAIAKTPIVRRLLNMGTDSFYRFRERVTMRYDPEGKTVDNPELLIKLMLEAILQVAMNGKDSLHTKNTDIHIGEFRDPAMTLALIQSRLYGSENQNKRVMSEALSEQGVFDIQSRRFNSTSLIARI
ncbi:hypothetical protein H7169_01360 [Candidatus Gracilibacteria bacterium]|nr:hypothetical protein [Candidatus Gracilibacteria bacterium]